MSNIQLTSADVLIYKPNSVKGAAIGEALRAMGFRNIRQADALEEVGRLAQNSAPDILLCAEEYAAEDLTAFIQSLREGKIAPNPFLIVLAASWCCDAETIDAFRNAGVDGFVSLPVSPETLSDLLQTQILKRKKFVATTDYIGPDRRRDPARSGAECFDVVNTLCLKALGSSAESIDQHIARAMQESSARLYAARQKSNVKQLCVQSRLLIRCESCSQDFLKFLCVIRGIAKDIDSRAGDPGANQAKECSTRTHCRTIMDCASSIESLSAVAALKGAAFSTESKSYMERLGQAVFALSELLSPASARAMASPQLDELAAKIDIRRSPPRFSAQPLSLNG